MSTDFFYADLPVLPHFWDIRNPENFTPVPPDWYVLVTDVTGSTQAIANGRYKAVTFLGAASIVAVLNQVASLDIPFVYGGDGATILVPPSLLETCRNTLLNLRRLARDEFHLDLRVGVVPIRHILAQNYAVKVAKIRVSEHYHQANFSGGGLLHANDLVKALRPGNLYRLDDNCRHRSDNAQLDYNRPSHNRPSHDRPNLSGLECRWQDIPNASGQVVSLIVTALGRSAHAQNRAYSDVLDTLSTLYGPDEFNPISAKYLRLSFNPRKLWLETQVRSPSSRPWQRWRYLASIWGQNLVGWGLMQFQVNTGDTDWGQYKDGLVITSDYQKFDDMLRMVIASRPDQTQLLLNYLKAEHRAGHLAYGVHISDRALMTCLVYERGGQQVHFVDGADGGYTLAARSLKHRLRRHAHQRRKSRSLLGR